MGVVSHLYMGRYWPPESAHAHQLREMGLEVVKA
jgi:hypothetical protein